MKKSQLTKAIERQVGYSWCAGFFEGEGCTGLSKGKTRKDNITPMYLRVAIGQVDREVLDRFLELIGVPGKVGGPWKRREDRIGNRHALVFTAGRAEEVLRRMWPYLGPVKKAQAEGKGFVYQ